MYEASKNEPTPLREEIDFYPPSFAESNFDGRERSSDAERVSGFEFGGINNNGVRETTREVPNDVNRRSEYQKKYQHVIPYNPLGRGRTEEAKRAVRNHPDFWVDAARNEIQMTNATIVEVAERMGIVEAARDGVFAITENLTSRGGVRVGFVQIQGLIATRKSLTEPVVILEQHRGG